MSKATQELFGGKAPYFVVDQRRKLVFGYFMKRTSAEKIEAMLVERSISPTSVRVDCTYNDSPSLAIQRKAYARMGYRLGTEHDLAAIEASKYLPEPQDGWSAHEQFNIGGVYLIQGDQMVIVEVASNGPKYTTYKAYNLAQSNTWTLKRTHNSPKAARVRMATFAEWARAHGRVEVLHQKRRERVENNVNHIDIMSLGIGDTVTVNYSNGRRDEVIEAINYKNGRVAIKRRGMAAIYREKRRFIDAKHIVKVVEKSPYERLNPINYPKWMR